MSHYNGFEGNSLSTHPDYGGSQNFNGPATPPSGGGGRRHQGPNYGIEFYRGLQNERPLTARTLNFFREDVSAGTRIDIGLESFSHGGPGQAQYNAAVGETTTSPSPQALPMGGVSLRRPHAIDKKVKFNEASTVGSEGTQDAVRENGVWHHQHGVPPPQPNNEYRSWVMAGQAGMIRGARNIDTISGADGRFDISSGLRASQSESRIQEPQMSQRRESAAEGAINIRRRVHINNSAEAADTATGGRPHLFTNQNNNALHLSLTPETHPIRNAAPPSNDEESHSSQTSGSTPRSNFMALIEEAIQYKDAGSSEYNNILRRLATDPPRKSMLVLLKQERGGWRHDHIDMDRDLTVGDVINGMTMLLSPEGEERSWELIRTALQDTETWRRFYDE